MMKRIPKGTLKVTTSELDGLEPHERSKKPTYQKKGHHTTSAFTKGVRSLTSPPRSRGSDGPFNVVSPTSPPATTGSQGSNHTFQFLRRPFGGASLHVRKSSSSASKRIQQIDTCGSSDTSSNSSGVLGIAAPPSGLVNDVINVSNEAADDDSLDEVVSNDSATEEDPPLIVTRSLYSSPPSSGDPSDMSSPLGHTHLLGITRPIYVKPATGAGEGAYDDDRLAHLHEEQESEIVFECSPDSSCSKREKFTLFEQSWLSDSDEDIQLEREQRSPTRQRQRDVVRTSRRESLERSSPQSVTSEQARDDSSPTAVRETFSARTKASPGELATTKVAEERVADPSDSVKIFVLLLQPLDKIFELIQLTYPREGTTLQSIIEMIPGNATEPVLASQVYVGVTRPKKRSPDFCDFTLTASDSISRGANFHSVGLQHGEIVVALPKGFTHHELVRLAKKILSNARIQSLLERSSAKVEKKSKNGAYAAPVHGVLDQQVIKDHEESMKRAVAAASVANAAVVSSPEPKVPQLVKSSKKSSSQKGLRHRINEDIPTSGAFVPALSSRQREAIKGMAKRSSASSVSSSSSRSSTFRTHRVLAELAKIRNESLLGAPKPLSSGPCGSSSATGASTPIECDDSLGIRIQSRDSVQSSHIVKPNGRVSPQKPCLATVGSPAYALFGPERGAAKATPVPSASSSLASSKSPSSSTARYSPTTVKPAVKSMPSDCSTCDRSVRSILSRRSTRSQVPRRDSFASLTQRSVVHSTSRIHRQRTRAAFASSLAWSLALLCMTMILRYYTDPTGYQAVKFHRNYNQPLGLLGGLQLFLLMSMLLKFQQSHHSAPTAAALAHQTRVRTPTVSRGARTPLLHRHSGARR